MEIREQDTAKLIFLLPIFQQDVRNKEPDRFFKIEQTINFPDSFQPQVAYHGESKYERRSQLASAFLKQASSMNASSLVTLLQQALQYQKMCNMPQTLTNPEVPQNIAAALLEKEEDTASLGTNYATIKFGKHSYANCAHFCSNGTRLATGSKDGFVEVWDVETGKLSALEYQQTEKFMMHSTAVLCLALSNDNTWLASGSEDGTIKVWHFETGKCKKRIEKVHTKPVSCLCFSPDGMQLVSGSQDCTLKVHGLQSGITLKEITGHQSFVNSALFIDNETIVTCSSDNHIRIWNIATMTCVYQFSPMPDRSVHMFHPFSPTELLICTASPRLILWDWKSKSIVQTYERSSAPNTGSDMICCAASAKGLLVYGLSFEDKHVTCFDAKTGQVVTSLQVCIVAAIYHVFIRYMSRKFWAWFITQVATF